MHKKGYVGKYLITIDVQLNLLKELIEKESKETLKNFLTQKTYYRLLKSIDKGIEVLPELVNNPELFVLYNIDDNLEAWVSGNNVLIFTCKSGTAVFDKLSEDNFGSRYIDNKFQ